VGEDKVARKPAERVGDIPVQLSHLDKVFFPDEGITKGDLIEYYRQLAPRIIGYLKDRPLVMGRYPDGTAGHAIVQKNVPGYFPDWISRAEVDKKDGTVCHAVCDKPATLVYLANQGCIELHAFLSRLAAVDRPDQLVFDLDPPDEAGFSQACRTAVELRELLAKELELTPYVKTTGGKGLHVHVPLRAEQDFATTRDFARDVASLLASRSPRQLTVDQRKEQRGNRLYLDVMRNGYAQTAVAPFSVRARPGAPVAVPVHWGEVEAGTLSPRDFTLRTIASRLEGRADPWADMARHRRGLPISRLAAISAS
jgi:bifunctional non-homologous end joining protein LigD